MTKAQIPSLCQLYGHKIIFSWVYPCSLSAMILITCVTLMSRSFYIRNISLFDCTEDHFKNRLSHFWFSSSFITYFINIHSLHSISLRSEAVIYIFAYITADIEALNWNTTYTLSMNPWRIYFQHVRDCSTS